MAHAEITTTFTQRLQGQILGHKPFEHPSMIHVIRERLLNDPRHAIVEEYPEYFKDGQVAPSAVAFAATAVSAIVPDEFF